MNVIHISKLQLLPSRYTYKCYVGRLEDCQRNFKADHQHYDPGTVYYCQPRQELYVPMQFDATAEVRDA